MSEVNGKPLITIGITCFNAEDTIGRCIASAVHQEWQNLDIVVVDDCSTDNSRREISVWQARDSRIRLIKHEENAGVGSARQSLLENASGEAIVFFDDDDVSEPNRVAVQYERLQTARDECGDKPILCFASGHRLYPNGYVKELSAIGSRGRPVCGRALMMYILANERSADCHYGAGTPACALMVGRTDAIAIGGFDRSFRRVEDLDFAVRAAMHAGCAVGAREQLFTQHATDSVDKSAYENYRAELQLTEKCRNFLENRGQYGAVRRWFGVRYRYFAGDHFRLLIAVLIAFAANPIQVGIRLVRNVPARLIHDYRRCSSTRARMGG